MGYKTGNVICFGEVLWDSVPRGLLPGGAPMNLAYHLSRLGRRAWMLSSVGRDVLGDELLRRLRGWEVETELIGVSDKRPTGLVRVVLANGLPAYDIVEEVAWDHIALPAALPPACRPVDAIFFGSLAQRTADNRATLERLLAQQPQALKVFDVNLRPPYVDRAHIRRLAGQSQLIKVNDEELGELLGKEVHFSELESGARELAEQTGCRYVCVTGGARGAGLLDRADWCWVDAPPVKVRDTIGAGDSFLAAVVHGLLLGHPHRRILAFATRLAGLVAASDGATPPYTLNELGDPVPDP